MADDNCDLNLLLRKVAGPKLGEEHADSVLLVRPPTRGLVAAGSENRFAICPNPQSKSMTLFWVIPIVAGFLEVEGLVHAGDPHVL
jgi:hypothetical protein